MTKKSPAASTEAEVQELESNHNVDVIPKKAQRRLIIWLGLIAFASFAAMGGIPGVVLPVQIQGIDPANKETILGTITATGAIVGVFLNPLWGAISDRTRSKLGRRAPVILYGVALTIAGVAFMASATAIWQLFVGMILLQMGLASSQSPIVAMLPDRLPARVRGLAASVLGFGIMVGAVVGQVVGARLAQDHVALAYWGGTIFMLLVLAGFLWLNPDKSSKDLELSPFRLDTFLRSYWVNPIKYPDFGYAFWSRGLTVLGYAALNTFMIYTLQDYVGLSETDALVTVPKLVLTGLAGMVIAIVISGWLSDKLGVRRPFVLAAAVIAGVAGLFPFFIPTINGMTLWAFFAGLGYGCFVAVDNALITQVLPKSGDSAKDIGVAFTASGGAEAIGPLLAALVVVQFGGYKPLFIVAMIASLLGGILVMRIKSVE